MTLSHVLSPGPREAGSWPIPIAPHGAHYCEIALRPPSGSTVWTWSSLITAADSLVTCTPSWSSRPDCTAHVPVSSVNAGLPRYGTAVPVASVAPGAGDAEPELAVGGLALLGASRYPAAYPRQARRPTPPRAAWRRPAMAASSATGSRGHPAPPRRPRSRQPWATIRLVLLPAVPAHPARLCLDSVSLPGLPYVSWVPYNGCTGVLRLTGVQVVPSGSDCFLIRSPRCPSPHAPSQAAVSGELPESGRYDPRWTTSSGAERAR